MFDIYIASRIQARFEAFGFCIGSVSLKFFFFFNTTASFTKKANTGSLTQVQINDISIIGRQRITIIRPLKFWIVAIRTSVKAAG